jgi:copper transport protein
VPCRAEIAESEGTMDSSGLLNTLMVLARSITSTALLILIGGTVFLAVIRWPNNDQTRHGRWLEFRAHHYLWGAWAAALVGTVVGVMLRGPAEDGLGFDAVFHLDTINATLGSRFGIAAELRVLFLLLVAPLLWAGWPWPGGGRRTAGHRRPGWLIAAALMLTPPLGGHAGGGSAPVYGVFVGWLHFSSAAVWLGGLILLLACVLPRSRVKLKDYVPQFSAIATTSIIIATITGSLQSWRQLGSLGTLFTTTYGLFLLAKLAAFGLLMLVAAGSHYLTKQAATDPDGLPQPLRRAGPGAALATSLQQEAARAATLRRFVIAEAVVAALVILATELMANTIPSYVEVQQEQGVVREAPAPAEPFPVSDPAQDATKSSGTFDGELRVGDAAEVVTGDDPAP